MIVTIGELLVEFVSHEIGCGLSKNTEFSGPYPSGAPAIFANQVARVGAQSSIFGSVGDDPFGQLLLGRLRADGVDVKSVRTHSTRTTGTAFVSYFDDGSRKFVFHLDGTAADQIDDNLTLESGAILHISGSSLGNKKIRQSIMGLVEQARSIGKISYDPNIRPELMQDASIKSCIDDIIDASDYLLPSEDDLVALFPSLSDETFIHDMLARGKTAAIVKRGAKGVIGSCGDGIISVDPIAVQQVDPTGAGDCFCGTFMGLIDQGVAFEEALRAANMAGALHVTQRGPMEWNPSLDEIRAQSSQMRAV